jgi:IPT/TIG domain
MNNIYPNSGPTSGVTDVIVEGKGFQYVQHYTAADLSDDDLQDQKRLEENEVLTQQLASDTATARCRFGTPANYAIVDAQILSYERMVCRAPQDFTPKEG